MEVALIVASLAGLAISLAWLQSRPRRRVRVRCRAGLSPGHQRGSPR